MNPICPPGGVHSKSDKERIEEFPAELRLVVLGGTVGVAVPVEPPHQIEDFLGRGHFMPIDPIIGDIGKKRLFVEEYRGGIFR